MATERGRSACRGLAVLALVIVSCGDGKSGPGATGAAGTSGAAGVAGPGGMSGTGGGGVTGVSGGGGATGGGGVSGVSGGGGSAGVSGTAGAAGNTSSGSAGMGDGPFCNFPAGGTTGGNVLCGNGAIDTYDVALVPLGTCPTVRITEQCDGTLFRPDSCAALGYGSGELSCTSSCNTDTSKCVDCATGPRIATCGGAPFAVRASAVAIAAANNEIGLAWMAQSGSAPPPLTFVRLSPTLQLLSTTPIEDATYATASAFAEDVRVAPLPAGWVIAAWASPELFLHVLDTAGRDLGRTTVDTVTTGPQVTHIAALVAPRAGGGPLMVWQAGPTTLRSAVVAADGRSTTTPRVLPFDARIIDATAAYVGGAFYVIASVAASQFPPAPPLRMVRIETDGTIGTPVDVLPGIQAIRPALVAGADDLRLFYDGPFPDDVAWLGPAGIKFRKISFSGASASDAVGLTIGPDYDRAPSGVALGADTAAVLPGAIGMLSGVRIGADGQIATPLFPIMASPHIGARGWNQLLARVGSDIVTVWYTDSAIRLARVTP